MIPARTVAALAAILTALLLQGSVIGPLTVTVPASLPAVLVAAVALTDGPGTGLAFGFASGLIADLASQHPAGVLALAWTALGTGAGLLARPHSWLRRDVLCAAVLAAAGTVIAALLLAVLRADGWSLAALTDPGGWRRFAAAGVADLVLAVLVVPLTRALLASSRLHRRRPVLLLGGDR